ncbi:uncharacterized protein SPAPADRAFT_61592 [Spathaspora passalidarum NRRL Y-27907]|uniref:Large ribosomal subunit protein mL50 n=1 Tax=Spathaspora passalidarum (strain NRRL Y-27907 / 11-Y1) TaxID=619300 RepID=G3ANJ8_SPAPN|nr:uncharacterized protein SPAPADRAFT_61592 [Spathaspora passalidarum NRRL Y-27907]EGW32527.1 hypothetical protein SPAPADRAFT_61592 [Spathaspora passalidarum NRRL Y-27907]
MLASVLRQRAVIRSFHATPVARSWIGDIFGKKKPAELEPKYQKKDKKEIVAQQDELLDEKTGKITILNEKNSPNYVKFDMEKDLPDFKINQWKKNEVLSQDLENTYSDKEELRNLVAGVYREASGDKEVNKFDKAELHDLKFRFKLVKELQSVLGFELNDYQVSKCHTLQALYEEIEGVVNKRWKNERNPSAIVLRPEDFKSSNIYLNQERSDKQKQRKLAELVRKAREESTAEVQATQA